MSAIEVDKLANNFGDLAAVDGVTLQVKPGEYFGFLGPNGAGKPTTYRCALYTVVPTSGLGPVLVYTLH